MSPVAVQDLDRWLTCRACEATCPSGVAYGELLEIGRAYMEPEAERGLVDRWQRRWLKAVVPHPGRFRRWVSLGRLFRWLLPRRLASVRLSRLPVERSSTTSTSEPPSTSRSTRWLPMKPPPPVTRKTSLDMGLLM